MMGCFGTFCHFRLTDDSRIYIIAIQKDMCDHARTISQCFSTSGKVIAELYFIIINRCCSIIAIIDIILFILKALSFDYPLIILLLIILFFEILGSSTRLIIALFVKALSGSVT
jgi:hypothetical protein